jgi:hypothetical protein
VVQPAHQQESQREAGRDAEQEDRRPIARRSIATGTSSQPPAATALAHPGADQQRVTGSMRAMNCTGNKPSATQPRPARACRRAPSRRRRAPARVCSSRGWPRKMMPKNLTMV